MNDLNKIDPTMNISSTVFKELKKYYDAKDDKYIFQLYFRTTNSCNYRCKYCFFNHELNKKRSLNIASSVAIVLAENLRQNKFINHE